MEIYWVKLNKLLKEVGDGEKIWEEYNENSHKISMKLISNHIWPHLLFDTILLQEIKLHPELNCFNNNFEEFYKK